MGQTSVLTQRNAQAHSQIDFRSWTLPTDESGGFLVLRRTLKQIAKRVENQDYAIILL